MTCTLDHSASAWVPEFLCRICHPELASQHEGARAMPVEDEKTIAERQARAERSERRARRRLRAEVKELREQLAALENRLAPASQIKAVSERLRSAERELYLVS